MADTKISGMTAAGTLDGTEVTPVLQGGANKRTTAQAIANLAPSQVPAAADFIGSTGTVFSLGTISSGLTLSANVLTGIPAVTTLSGASHTLLAAHNGRTLSISHGSAIVLTVPASLPHPFQCVIIQAGAGAITPTASSTTINQRAGDTKTAGQYSVSSLISTASNVYVFAGDTAA